MTKKELRKLFAAVEEPLSWDCRGSDEEYEAVEKANDAWDEIKALLKEKVLPTLE